MIKERLKHLNAEFRTANARLEDIPPDNFEQMTIEDIRVAFLAVTVVTQRLQELQKEYVITEEHYANP